MEHELWKILLRRLDTIPSRRPPRTQYTDHDIARVILWAALHDRPICWACRREHWPTRSRHRLPDAATVSRRSKTLGVRKLLRRLIPKLDGAKLLCIDGKPLRVSRFSKDKDARRGYGVGGIERGYKLTSCAIGTGI